MTFLRNLLPALAIFPIFGLPMFGQQLAGEWIGKLSVGYQEMRLVLHLSGEAEGKGTLDSIDQGVFGIPVSSASIKGKEVRIEMPTIGATFIGELKGDAMKGLYNQKSNVQRVEFSRAPVAAPEVPKGAVEEWRGSLKAGPAELPLILRTWRASGAMHASLESPAQGMAAIPATDMKVTGNKLSFSFKGIAGAYEGQFSDKRDVLHGTWKQAGQESDLEFKRARITVAAPPGIEGVWEGALAAGAVNLRVAFHFDRDTRGTLVATMDSPDQNIRGVTADSISFADSKLHLEVKKFAGTYDANYDAVSGTLSGSWNQRGASVPLNIQRVEKVTELRRPQDPVRPYPYLEEEVHVENAPAHVTLAGTLTVPKGIGPFPVALLITGSGPQDRDSFLMGHRPFLVLADRLTRAGVAVLRLDDRGTGKSTGDFSAATSADFSTDAESAVAFLRNRKDIDGRRIGLIGHSEGAMIAAMIAARSGSIAWIVMLAGSAMPGDELLLRQVQMLAKTSGADEKMLKTSSETQRKLMDIVLQNSDPEVAAKKLREAGGGNPAVLALNSPWFRYFLSYDPRPALEKVTCPVLAVAGSNDLQVPSAENLEAIKQALIKAHNTDVKVVELPKVNHLLQTSETGLPSEYAKIEETISPSALDLITSWVAAHSKGETR